MQTRIEYNEPIITEVPLPRYCVLDQEKEKEYSPSPQFWYASTPYLPTSHLLVLVVEASRFLSPSALELSAIQAFQRPPQGGLQC